LHFIPFIRFSGSIASGAAGRIWKTVLCTFEENAATSDRHASVRDCPLATVAGAGMRKWKK
jgi:hypothetical protein